MAVIEQTSVPSPGKTRPHIKTIGRLRIDLFLREVRLDGEPVSLTRLEWDLLLVLAQHPTRVFTREELHRAIWGNEMSGSHALSALVYRLRPRLGGQFIHCVHQVGYRLCNPLGEPSLDKRRYLITDSRFVVQAGSEDEARAIYLDKGGEFVTLTELDVQEAP